MAVQAQYPSNILQLNRNIQENKNIILGTDNFLHPQQFEGEFLEQSHMFFNNNVGVNPRKRNRETTTTTTTTTTINGLNLSQQSHQFIDICQLQNQQQQQQQQQNGVSTGLKLSFGEQNQQQQQQQKQQQRHMFSEDLSFQFKQQSDELNYFLIAQGEQLRRTLAEKTQRHYRALLSTAEEAVTRRIREKQAEVDIAIRRNAELQARAAQISAEAQAWQIRAQNQEAQAMSLQAQIQQAIIGPNNVGGPLTQDREAGGPGDASDAESSYVDPTSDRRVNKSSKCMSCRTRDACVVLLPCRHLCVCVQCDKVAQNCPVCYSLRSASVEVFFS